jgi:hypothetical protein
MAPYPSWCVKRILSSWAACVDSALVGQKFDAGKVADVLKSVFGDRTLGSTDFRTGLMVMTKRLDTGSPWPLTNHPKAHYFEAKAGHTTVANRDYPLWAVVRASTAALNRFAKIAKMPKPCASSTEEPLAC